VQRPEQSESSRISRSSATWDGLGLRQGRQVPCDRSVRLCDRRGDPDRRRVGAGVTAVRDKFRSSNRPSPRFSRGSHFSRCLRGANWCTLGVQMGFDRGRKNSRNAWFSGGEGGKLRQNAECPRFLRFSILAVRLSVSLSVYPSNGCSAVRNRGRLSSSASVAGACGLTRVRFPVSIIELKNRSRNGKGAWRPIDCRCVPLFPGWPWPVRAKRSVGLVVVESASHRKTRCGAATRILRFSLPQLPRKSSTRTGGHRSGPESRFHRKADQEADDQRSSLKHLSRPRG
jgi:hypothetical protein